MKASIFALSAAVLMAACNNTPKTTETTVDTTLHPLDTVAVQPAELTTDSATSQATKTESHKTSTATTKHAHSSASTTSSGAISSSSESEAKAKKGWSKTAKGAVIGAAAGAGTGAVINKKNRAKGAVIGGVVGAGAGAIIGHDMDKKDGRH